MHVAKGSSGRAGMFPQLAMEPRDSGTPWGLGFPSLGGHVDYPEPGLLSAASATFSVFKILADRALPLEHCPSPLFSKPGLGWRPCAFEFFHLLLSLGLNSFPSTFSVDHIKSSLFKIDFMCMSVLFRMPVLCTQKSEESSTSPDIEVTEGCEWILRTETGSSERPTSAFSYWAISPASHLSRLKPQCDGWLRWSVWLRKKLGH